MSIEMLEYFKKLKDFLVNVSKDERIPERDKKVLAALIVLLISPLDIIPDWIPIFGVIDDFIILCIIADYFFQVLDTEILLTHYPWGMKSFARIRKMANFLSLFVPSVFKNMIWKYAKIPY